MPERKMVIDFESEIKVYLAAIKKSGMMNVDTNAIHQLCLIFSEVTGDKVCLTCPRELSKVYKYFLHKARYF